MILFTPAATAGAIGLGDGPDDDSTCTGKEVVAPDYYPCTGIYENGSGYTCIGVYLNPPDLCVGVELLNGAALSLVASASGDVSTDDTESCTGRAVTGPDWYYCIGIYEDSDESYTCIGVYTAPPDICVGYEYWNCCSAVAPLVAADRAVTIG